MIPNDKNFLTAHMEVWDVRNGFAEVSLPTVKKYQVFHDRKGAYIKVKGHKLYSRYLEE